MYNYRLYRAIRRVISVCAFSCTYVYNDEVDTER